jgi:hypothetical protein
LPVVAQHPHDFNVARTRGRGFSSLERAGTGACPNDPPDIRSCQSSDQATKLHTLIETIGAPYGGGADNHQSQASVTDPNIMIAGLRSRGFALLRHEFATNAAKYGALSVSEGRVDIAFAEEGDNFVLTWTESGGLLSIRRWTAKVSAPFSPKRPSADNSVPRFCAIGNAKAFRYGSLSQPNGLAIETGAKRPPGRLSGVNPRR